MIVGRQEWEHLLFVHYKVDEAALREIVPRPLVLDHFDEELWVTIITFRIRGSRPIGVPRVAAPVIPGSSFEELNFRTYVRGPDGTPGIWFFSLDAASQVAVMGARAAYRLPYFHADMRLTREQGSFSFFSQRARAPQRCEARYRPMGTPSPAVPGTLDHFLVERYVLFVVDEGVVSAARVTHDPYPLQSVSVEEWKENLLEQRGLKAGPFARAHYAERLEVGISAPYRVAG